MKLCVCICNSSLKVKNCTTEYTICHIVRDCDSYMLHTCFYISAFLRMWAFMYMYVYYAWLIFAYGHIIQGNFLVAVMLIFFSHSVTWAGPETPQSACCICTLFKILYGVQSHLSTIKVFSYTCCLFSGSLLIVACFNAVVDLNCGIIL